MAQGIRTSFSFSDLQGYVNKTLPMVEKEVHDSIFNESTYLKYMDRFGGVVRGETGDGIYMALEMAKNDSVGWRRLRDPIPLRGQDLHRMGFQDFAEISGAIVLDWVTQKKNEGKEKMIDYYESEIQNVKKTLYDTINTGLLTGSGTLPTVTGLDSLIAETVTSGTIHGIPRSTNTWVRNQTTDSSCSTTDAFGTICIKEFDELIKLASGKMGSKSFKLAMMDDTVHANMLYYMPGLGNMRPIVTNNTTMPVEGYKVATEPEYYIRQALAIWDHACSADSIRLIDPSIIKVHFLKDTDVKILPASQAEDSFTRSIIIGASMAHMNHNPFRTAVLYNFDA